MNCCDIIVPIYVPSEETLTLVKSCLKSIVDKTKFPYRLILINDLSPLEELTQDFLIEFLNEHQENHDIVVINNERNYGFVKTVNIGMSQSTTNDVVLLNNDTEVTYGWLTKMEECAYSDDKIATVSPFSNAATILSLPVFLEDNSLPDNYSLEEVARLVEKYSPVLRPELPTAHGFCMFIKRSILNLVGLFDHETFGRGYGEENDFSCRCISLGYQNILDDRTFIYHKGEASFQGGKAKIIEKHLNIINERYPFYLKSIQNFITVNPLKIHQNIFNNLINLNHKVNPKVVLDEVKNILIIVHGFGGGTQKYIDDLKVRLEDKFNLFSLVSYRSHFELIFPDQTTKVQIQHPHELIDFNTTSTKYFYSILKELITDINPQVIFVNSFIFSSFDIVTIANEKSIPIVYTLHDFNLICPTNHFIDNENNYCGICEHGSERKNCLVGNMYYWINNMSAVQLNLYRDYVAENVIEKIDFFISPSDSAAKIFKSFYNKRKINISVIEHAIPPIKKILENRSDNINIKIAVIGSIGHHKGIKYLPQICRNLNKAGIEVHLFGELEFPIKGIIDHGTYEFNKLQDKIAEERIDIALLPSIWPETFMYTLSECIELNIPIITNELGAPGDRVNKLGVGWVTDTSDTSKVTKLILDINEDRELLLEKKAKIKLINTGNYFEYLDRYEQLFTNITSSVNNDSYNSAIYKRLSGHNTINLSHNSQLNFTPEFIQLMNIIKGVVIRIKLIYLYKAIIFVKRNGFKQFLKKLFSK